jgi:hypothetical protein
MYMVVLCANLNIAARDLLHQTLRVKHSTRMNVLECTVDFNLVQYIHELVLY